MINSNLVQSLKLEHPVPQENTALGNHLSKRARAPTTQFLLKEKIMKRLTSAIAISALPTEWRLGLSNNVTYIKQDYNWRGDKAYTAWSWF